MLPLLLAGALLAGEVNVEIDTLSGAKLAGGVRSWDENALVLATTQGERTLAVKDLLAVRATERAASPAGDWLTVELIDGSVLAVKSLQLEKGQATLATPDGGSLV